jgi:predicted glycogen debranching enzyme
MSYIQFDKQQLINLEYSLKRELIRSNRAGGYASKTLVGCNTRKYHGLLVLPQPAIDDDNHVLLANLDETVIQHDASFNLGIHKFPGGVYQPKGHKYLREFNAEPIPSSVYRVGGVVLRKEIIFSSNEDRLLIRYTLEEAHSPTTLRLTPLLAFRNVHSLTRANVNIEKKYSKIKNGVKMRMYTGYSYLHLQTSKQSEYTHVPDWYYNIEYQEEQERGYEYQEDLYTPGFFEFRIRKGESVIFSAGIKEAEPRLLKRKFTNEVKNRIPRDNFENCLVNSAEQFIVKQGKKAEIMAGFPWFGRWGRDTFISVPGLLLVTGQPKLAKAVIDTMVSELKGPLFPDYGKGDETVYNAMDTSLWFFWALQQYVAETGSGEKIWKGYGRKMKMILNGFREGETVHVRMVENGLLSQGAPGLALTWMDAFVDGKPVTPRTGLAVEVNALWYNAIMFSLEMAELGGEKKFVKEWRSVAESLPAAFIETFWDEESQYLADTVHDGKKDLSVKPNMVFAASLPYTMLDESKRMQVLEVVKRELLTPKGLRTLSPKNIAYKGRYEGGYKSREEAYHQGSAFPWLLGHYCEGYLKIYGESGKVFIREIYEGFEEEMSRHGIGTISEVYDGDPPHLPGGAISQAWSVAELLRIGRMLNKI